MPAPQHNPDTASEANAAWIGHLYTELHAIAERCFRSERREHTLQPTALVHEAMIRLSGYRAPEGKDATENLLALAAVVMRRVLVDHARRRRSRIQGVPLSTRVPIVADDSPNQTPMDVLLLDEMLERLARVDPRASRIIELRFFGGLSVQETARFLTLSDSTVEADSRFALAWMRRDLTPDDPNSATP